MSKHTPGPWKVSPNWPFPDDSGRLHDAVVAVSPDGTEALICSFEHSVFRDSQNPNARLIAEAPAMLEALKALVEVGRYLISPVHESGAIPGRSDHDILLAAWDAIERAEGR